MWTLKEIAEHIDGQVQGDHQYRVSKIATLQDAQEGQLTFLSNKKYKKHLASTAAGAVIVTKDIADLVVGNAIIVDDPYVAYAQAARLLNPFKKYQAGIHPTASISAGSDIHPSVLIGASVVIGSGVVIAENVVIGAGCVLLDDITIGDSTHLMQNITVCDGVIIGDRCNISPGVVIGADGFGIANNKGKWIQVPQLGSVTIGDDVDIGANTTIDCGAIDDTIIRNGVKLDNQIQVGHNVIIDENTVIAGCTGIAGSTYIGKNCIIGGGVCISGHLTIVDSVQVTGMTMVTKSIKFAGSYSSGIPAEPSQQWHKNTVHYRQIDKLIARVKKLEQLDFEKK